MIKKILLIAAISAIVYLLLQMFGAWRVFKQSDITFLDFSDIVDIFSGDRKITVKIFNPTKRKIVAKNINVEIENGEGTRMGAFKPIDLTVKEGQNDVIMTFTNDTKYLKIGTDYVTGSIGGYKLVFSGLWLGFVPFRFKMKLNRFIN